MSIICCNCYFDYYLLKINRDPEFLKSVKSLNSEDWPKIPLKDPSFPKSKEKLVRTRWSVLEDEWPKAASSQGWYSQAPGFLFHACRACICKLLEITAATNCSSVREVLNRTCYFVNSQWITLEENCLDKIRFELNGRAGRKYENILSYVCYQCQSKLCLMIIHKEFNYLDKSCIIKKKWTP